MTKEFDERNMAKSRRVCEDMEAAHVTKWLKLTERERHILAMWPRFEDGEPVWIGDDVSGMDVRSFVFTESGAMVTNLTSVPAYGECRKYGEPFKRPAPKVLDADGVEIKVGDTVWHHSGFAHGVVTSIDAGSLMGTVRYVNGGVEFRDAAKDLTHACPDSWERLEEDAVKVVCEYAGAVPDEFGDYDCDTCRLFNARGNLICEQLMTREIVRRAKALAGVEVSE